MAPEQTLLATASQQAVAGGRQQHVNFSKVSAGGRDGRRCNRRKWAEEQTWAAGDVVEKEQPAMARWRKINGAMAVSVVTRRRAYGTGEWRITSAGKLPACGVTGQAQK